MLQLPNGCKCSDFSVWPKNWKTIRASVAKDWYITYRFYDPTVTDAAGKMKPKLVMVKGMNHYKTQWERKQATEVIMQDELHSLQHGGFNPFKKAFVPQVEGIEDIPPTMSMTQALRIAFDKGEFTGRTLTDIRSVLNYIEPAAYALNFHLLSIGDVKKKHIRILLEKTGKMKSNWTNNNFNTYRKYLSILFNLLVDDYEAIGANPVKNIRKKKVTKPKRQVLTPEQCQQVDAFARKYDIRLWMLIHIFYHSGSRTTELFRVQGKHVNLQRQEVLYLVKKGRTPEWISRPIKDIALPFWQMAMEGCGTEDFVFSKGLRPGPRAIRADQITKRWKRHFKNAKQEDKLNVKCDFYSLKHLNTTTTIDWLENNQATINGQQLAAGQNGHKSEAMVVKIYDVKGESRQQDKLRRVGNKFA